MSDCLASKYCGRPLSVLRVIDGSERFQPIPKGPLPDPDEEFAAALARSPSVLAFAYSDDAALAADPSIQFGYGFSIIGAVEEAYVANKVQGGEYAILPLPVLMQAAHGLGEVHAGEPDADPAPVPSNGRDPQRPACGGRLGRGLVGARRR